MTWKVRPIIPGIPSEWTGESMQMILSILCSSFLFFGCLILVCELLNWPPVLMTTKYLREILSIVKYFDFVVAAFTFVWYLYDVFVYNPHYEASEKLSPVPSSNPQQIADDDEESSSEDDEPDWPLPELEPGHPLVVELKGLRELALATSYRRRREFRRDDSGLQRRSTSRRECEESH